MNYQEDDIIEVEDYIPTWIAYKVRQDYPTTGRVYWSQKLDGPYKNSTALSDAYQDLLAVKRESGDVKDINLLVKSTI